MGEQTKKSFWGRPEGTTGWILMIAAIAVAVYFSGIIIPFIIGLLANLVGMCILGGIVLAVAYVIFDPKMRATFFYAFKLLCRAITSLVITIDPIGIAKERIAQMKKKLEEVSENISKVSGQKQKLAKIINTNVSKMKDLKVQYDILVKEGASKPRLTTVAIEMGSLDNQNKNLLPIHDTIVRSLDTLRHMQENIGEYVIQQEITVRNKEAEYVAIKEANKAMKGVYSIISGGNSENDLFFESMDYINDDIAKKMGEMDQILNNSASFLEKGDMDRHMSAVKGEATIGSFDPSSINLLTVEELETVRKNPEAGVSARTSSKYSDFQ